MCGDFLFVNACRHYGAYKYCRFCNNLFGSVKHIVLPLVEQKIITMRYNGNLMSKEIVAKRTIDKKNAIVISMRKAAELSKISVPTFSRISNGSEPDVNNLFTVCKWLGKPMEYFFTKK